MPRSVNPPPHTPVSDRVAVVHQFTGALREKLTGLDSSRVWALTTAEVGESLREVYAIEAQLVELKSSLLRHAQTMDLAAHDASVNLTAWLRTQTRTAPGAARKHLKLAQGLAKHETVREALARGEFPAASAEVILDAVEKLPADAEEWVHEHAVKHLTGEAHAHDTAVLRMLAARLEEVVDPDGADQRLADQRLAEQLAKAEAEAARKAYLSLHHDEETQTSQGAFRIPLLEGVKLQKMLEALLNPDRPDSIERDDPDTGVKYSCDELRGHAFTQLINRIPLGNLPRTGGCDPAVVITMDLATLMGGLKAAQLDTGHRIGPGLARKLAAQAGVIPAVFGGKSETLDLGRKTRLFTKKQRLAMNLQQHGRCAVEDCDRPAAWGEAHHLTPWSAGGESDLTNGVIICQRHHTLAHHPNHTVTLLRPGKIRINRRT